MSAQIFSTGMYGGSILLAVWVYVRLPRLRPTGAAGAIGHVAASYAAFHLAPVLVSLVGRVLPAPASIVVAVAAVVVPGLCYLYVSWLWLMTWVARRLWGGPRGGQLARTGR
jgi:hypothetical protein